MIVYFRGHQILPTTYSVFFLCTTYCVWSIKLNQFSATCMLKHQGNSYFFIHLILMVLLLISLANQLKKNAMKAKIPIYVGCCNSQLQLFVNSIFISLSINSAGEEYVQSICSTVFYICFPSPRAASESSGLRFGCLNSPVTEIIIFV